jgi:hypothetical protein
MSVSIKRLRIRCVLVDNIQRFVLIDRPSGAAQSWPENVPASDHGCSHS